MRLVGKCPPSSAELTAAADRGFDAVELYLEPSDLDDLAQTKTTVRDAPVDVASVHTPHVTTESRRAFSRADRLAVSLDATLVVHSQYLHHTHIDELESIGFEATYGYENIPGVSRYHLENTVFSRGHRLILDTAHLFLGESKFLREFERILREHGDRIPVVHLNDATVHEDGLPFGEGEMTLRPVVARLVDQFEGTVVLEVMPNYQREALLRTRSWIDSTADD